MPAHIDLSVKQKRAIESTADIVVLGGGNFGGKSYGLRALLLQPMYLMTPGCQSVIFAESNPKLVGTGMMQDKCRIEYGAIHPKGQEGYKQTPVKRWTWPSGSTVDLSFIGEPGKWDGMEAAVICIDQVEQITWPQFDSVIKRNRTSAPVKPRIFVTANPPDSGQDHWLTKLLDAGGWLDKNGDAIPAMDGVVRYFVIKKGEFIFADTVEQLRDQKLLVRDRYDKEILPKSLTFVQALVDDHPCVELREQEKVNLASGDEFERARRLYGNWHAIEIAGKYFQGAWFAEVDYTPSFRARQIRSWDMAWSESDGADWTPGLLMSQEPDNFVTIVDLIRFRGSPFHVERAIKLIAELDGVDVEIRLPKDAGRAGFDQSELARWLRANGYTVHLTKDIGDKITRSKQYQGRCEGREVRLAKSHMSCEVAEELMLSFKRFDPEGKEIEVKGLDRSNISTLSLKEWHHSFRQDHIRFGRDTIKKAKVKKDVVDAAVGGNDVLTNRRDDPAGDDPEVAREIMCHLQQPAPRMYDGMGGGRVRTPSRFGY